MKALKATMLIGVVLFFMVELYLILMIVLGPENEYKFYGYNHIHVVPFNQPVSENNTVQVGIGKMRPFDINQVEVGDFIVAYNGINTQYLWVHQIISINESNETITAAVNDILGTYVLNYSDAVGIYVADANFFEQFLFISSDGWIYSLNIGASISITVLLSLWIVVRQRYSNEFAYQSSGKDWVQKNVKL